jgi:hypothetical protein
MIRRIIENFHGHPLKNQKILVPSDCPYATCSQGKFVIKSSPSKVIVESPSFLQRIQGDICGSIHLPCGSFRYFIVLIDTSTRWSHVCLFSTRNVAFARLLAQIIRLRAKFFDYPIQSIRMDNLVNLHPKHFMTITCQLVLMLNILLLIPIPKMVYPNHLLNDFS